MAWEDYIPKKLPPIQVGTKVLDRNGIWWECTDISNDRATWSYWPKPLTVEEVQADAPDPSTH